MSRRTRSGKRPPGPDSKLTFVHWLQYLALRFLALVFNLMPFFLARACGRGVGRLFLSLFRRKREIGLLNLDQVFQDNLTESEKHLLLKQCLAHFGNMMAETLCFSQINSSNFLKYVELDNIGQFYKGRELGNGVILCSAHYGNWEIMNLALGYMNLPMSAMARPMDNPLVHGYIERLRRRSGNGVIYKHRSVRKILSNLAENRVVGIVNDQDVHDHNRIFVDFFGRPAATTPLPAAVSYKTGAPIVVGYSIPLGKGRYRLRFHELIHPNKDADKDEEILRISTLLNAHLEQQIRDAPPYWMWIHQRYKTDVDGKRTFYKQKRTPKA